jgi:hypothetical protein
MTNVIRSCAVADRAISVRLDGEAQQALAWIMERGFTQSEAIREALVSAAQLREREQMEADAKRVGSDPLDREVIAELAEFFGEVELPPG